MRASRAGYVDGRHFTEFVDEVRNLKASANHTEAEMLLLFLIDATESAPPPAPWYYEQLAIIYRKDERLADEAAILKRFLSHNSSSQTTIERSSYVPAGGLEIINVSILYLRLRNYSGSRKRVDHS